MMKSINLLLKKTSVCLMFLLLFSLTACSASQDQQAEIKLGPADILDNDTGNIYSLGMNKEVFDDAFGNMPITQNADETLYLSGNLAITYENDIAKSIRCEAITNRFSFYNFNFDMEIAEIEGRYEKDDTSTSFTFYTRYYDENGNDVSIENAKTYSSLMVCKKDFANYTKGQYLDFEINQFSSK